MTSTEKKAELVAMPLEEPAFKFDNCVRNQSMCRLGYPAPKLTSTGTTIVGVSFPGGVVVGADSRATQGNVIADKNCMKVHKLTDSIFACGAGTAADLDQVCNMISANLRLLELNTGKKSRVVTALRMAKQHLFNYQGYVGAYLVIGGVDPTGSHLYECSANGTSMAKPYVCEGSGSYAAVSVLEKDYRFDLDVEGAKKLIAAALQAGMHGDNASGNSYNLVSISAEKTVFEGPFVPDFCKRTSEIELDYTFKSGSTAVLKRKTIAYEIVEKMDTQP